jgi:hypothetical protein
MQRRGAGGWVRRQGWKVDRRRESRVSRRQRRKDAAAEESEVEFEGQAERPNRRRESETGREAEPEMQQPESDSWFVRQGWKVGRRRKPQVGRKAAPKGSADDESRRLGSQAEPEG